MRADGARGGQALAWVMRRVACSGRRVGQRGCGKKCAGTDWEDKGPRDRYAAESRRLRAVLDQRRAGCTWIMGDDYSIADIATFPWVRNLVGFY